MEVLLVAMALWYAVGMAMMAALLHSCLDRAAFQRERYLVMTVVPVLVLFWVVPGAYMAWNEGKRLWKART